MSLPAFEDTGDLPLGVHRASLQEVLDRFGTGSPAREAATATLLRAYGLASGTGKLDRCILFGSYVTAKQEPNDVDLILVMTDDFVADHYGEETRTVFDHRRAADVLGASVFWLCRSSTILETLDEFIAHWQVKRDHTLRGIVEVVG